MNETAALERDLTGEVGVAIDQIVMNALYPERFSTAEEERMGEVAERQNGILRAACRAGVSQSRRARAQREQLVRLIEMTESPVTTLPFLFEPELGVEEARVLAEELG